MPEIKQIELKGIVYDIRDESKQPALISGENIKTINGESLLGEGNLEIKQDFEAVIYSAHAPEQTAFVWAQEYWEPEQDGNIGIIEGAYEYNKDKGTISII